MAKKNFKGGLDSLIENSLGIRKSGRKGEMKGNPIDLLPEQTEAETPAEQPQDKTQTPATESVVSVSAESKPTETKPEAKPAEGQAEVKPAESQAEAKPAESGAEVKSAESQAEVKPAENQAEVKPAESQAEAKPAESQTEPEPAEVEVEVKTKIAAPTLVVEANDSEKNTYLKNMIADLRKELFLWRNGKLNVQSFNASLHSHGLKYNSESNEIEEM